MYLEGLKVSRTLKTRKAMGLQGRKIFPSGFVFSSERPHYSLALFSSFKFQVSRAQLEQKKNFAIKRTLQLLPGHIEESSY